MSAGPEWFTSQASAYKSRKPRSPNVKFYTAAISADGVNWRSLGNRYSRGRKAAKEVRRIMLACYANHARVLFHATDEAEPVLYAQWKIGATGFPEYVGGTELSKRRQQHQARHVKRVGQLKRSPREPLPTNLP